MRTKAIIVPRPRKFDCANYLNCLTEAAISNSYRNMCVGCGNYRKIGISNTHAENVSFSSKRDYIQYEAV